MGDADVHFVAIVVLLAITYGIFMYLHSDQPAESSTPSLPAQDYTAPESSSFFSTLQKMIALNMENPELFFVNSILFGTIAFLGVFVFLRYLRGTG